MEKWNVPILLPKSIEKWRSGETECSNTTSQIYGKMEKWRNGMFHYYFPNLWKMEKWRNGMFRYYFPNL